MPQLIGYVIWLSLRDFLHDRRMSICHILGLAAVLAPLLILFGLKHGFIAGETEKMIQNISKRKLQATLGKQFTQAEVQDLKGDARIEFVVPGTRTLASTLDWIKNPRGQNGEKVVGHVTIRPTGEQDPLFRKGAVIPVKEGQVALTHELARQLDAKTGDKLTTTVVRRRDGQLESRNLELTVAAVLAEGVSIASSLEIVVPLTFCERLEDFLDGKEVPTFWAADGNAALARSYPTLRLHARRLEDVPALHAELTDKYRATVFSQAADVGALLALDRNLSLAYWVIALIGTLGYLMALIATIFANVQRKRRDLAVLGQLGVTGQALVLFPITQALLLALNGATLSLVIYGLAAIALNLLFASGMSAGTVVCRLGPDHAAIAVIATSAVTMVASALSSCSVSRIDPAEVLREH